MPDTPPSASGDPLRETCRRVLLSQLDTAPDDLTDATRLADLGLDSLDEVQLALDLEHELGIVLPDPVAFPTFGAMVAEAARAARQGAMA